MKTLSLKTPLNLKGKILIKILPFILTSRVNCTKGNYCHKSLKHLEHAPQQIYEPSRGKIPFTRPFGGKKLSDLKQRKEVSLLFSCLALVSLLRSWNSSLPQQLDQTFDQLLLLVDLYYSQRLDVSGLYSLTSDYPHNPHFQPDFLP